MTDKSKSFITHPSGLVVIVFAIICFVGNLFLISAATNAFTETLFQRKNIVIIGLMSMSILVTFMIYANYIKIKYSK